MTSAHLHNLVDHLDIANVRIGLVKYKVVDLGISFPKPLRSPQLELGIKSYGQDTMIDFVFYLTNF